MASMRVPSIACIGIIDKKNRLLHMSLFPASGRDPLEYQFHLSSCLDIFDARLPHKTLEQDFGLLQAIDERLAMYGRLTNTGMKLVIVIDAEGRTVPATDVKAALALAVRAGDLRPVFRAIQTAYIDLLKNPFYTPMPTSSVNSNGAIRSVNERTSHEIKSQSFTARIRKIGESWTLLGVNA